MAPQDLGTLELSETARTYVKYDMYDEAEMIATSGIEMSLMINNTSSEVDQVPVELGELPCLKNRTERVLSTFKREKIEFELIGDQGFRKAIGIIGVKLIVQKKIDHNNLNLQDHLEVFPLVSSSNEQGYEVGDNALFSMTLSDKDEEDVDPYITHDMLKFKTRWYDDVYEGPWSKEGLKVYVRKDLGIVAVSAQGSEQVYLKGLH